MNSYMKKSAAGLATELSRRGFVIGAAVAGAGLIVLSGLRASAAPAPIRALVFDGDALIGAPQKWVTPCVWKADARASTRR